MKPRFCVTMGVEVLCSTIELTEKLVVGVAVCEVVAILSVIPVILLVVVAVFIVAVVVSATVVVVTGAFGLL